MQVQWNPSLSLLECMMYIAQSQVDNFEPYKTKYEVFILRSMNTWDLWVDPYKLM